MTSTPRILTNAEVILVKDLGALVSLNVPIQPTPGVLHAIVCAKIAGFVQTAAEAEHQVRLYRRGAR